MKDTGLSDAEVELIRTVLRQHAHVSRAILFGSRAKGVATPHSDIDLAVCGLDSALKTEALALDLEELPLPYKFDVLDFEALKNEVLREHVERVGIEIYKRVSV